MRILCLIGLAIGGVVWADSPPLSLREGDRVVVVGNTFAERMRYYGQFEARLQARFPELGLTFRNLGWSADEVALQPRPQDFGDVHSHLEKQQADVVFLCYGLNESFKGEAGLEQFKSDLKALIDAMLAHRYNGDSAPRLVVVSPMPQEPIPGMEDVSARNDDIQGYTDAMVEVAEAAGIVFLDLFRPVREYQANLDAPPLTFNGIHMEDYGYWVVSEIMMRQLGFEPTRIELEAKGPAPVSVAVELEKLPPPPPPIMNNGVASLMDGQVLIRVTGLERGTYALMAGDTELASARADLWANGLIVPVGPVPEVVEAMRNLIVEKDQLFFDRYRAINGFYIYGGRKEPFGVVSFPPEMERFDELVTEHDGRIHAMAKAGVKVELRLVAVDR